MSPKVAGARDRWRHGTESSHEQVTVMRGLAARCHRRESARGGRWKRSKVERTLRAGDTQGARGHPGRKGALSRWPTVLGPRPGQRKPPASLEGPR